MTDDERMETADRRASPKEVAAFEASRSDRDRTLDTLHVLEEALGTAAPGREEKWLEDVLSDLASLEEAVSSERKESLEPDSLLSMISHDYPRRFGSRVRQLRNQHEDITRQVDSLRTQLEEVERDSIDFADVRQRVEWVIKAIRHRRAKETDLVFEAIDLDFGRPES
ncbi:MAG TPA: hypothetical protein VFS38_07995 [Actinomycetota bacterium]|nr:hypothetical protein [Actinomycetota bacterium]